MSADDLWRQMSDQDVIAASLHLDDYTEEGQTKIKAELSRRGLSPPAPDAPDDPILSVPIPKDQDLDEFDNRFPLVRLWLGGYPLRIAFWGWLMFGQLVWAGIFMVSSKQFLLLAGFALGSMVYTAVALIGVWRSAKRYKGPERWATLAQVVVIVIVVGFVGDLLKSFFRTP